MNKPFYLSSAAILLMVFVASGCVPVGSLTKRLAKGPPPVLAEVRNDGGMRVEVWQIKGRPYKKTYIKDGKKVREEIFTEDGRLSVERVNLASGIKISKMFDEKGRLKSLSKDVPGSPVWHFFEVYKPDGSVQVPGRWRPSISPKQAKEAGIFEQVSRGFDEMPPNGAVPIASQNW
ncbi:hypothetical protein [Prosthecobacter sp.]|uniref:hypothetical protein n=1 Tax=Prosthecobacter sp. TaxID=1965333 RepID=UPI0037841EA3